MLTRKQKLQKWLKKIKLRVAGKRGSAKALFIFGEMRSGTNMLIDVLSRSSYTECYGENDEDAFEDYVLKDDVAIEKLIIRSCARTVVFKPITGNQRARAILDRHPGSKAIWIVRRYQDVVNSALRKFTEHRKYLYYMLHEPEVAQWRVENTSPENMKLVEKHYNRNISEASARALIWYLRNSHFFQQNLNEDSRVMCIRYEDIVTNPNRYIQQIFDFVDLEYEQKVRKSVFRSSVNKHPFPEIDSDIRQLCDSMYASLEDSMPCRAA